MTTTAIQQAMVASFKERAVELMRGIGVEGVDERSLLSNHHYRAQFRAMLVDARKRFAEDTENRKAIEALIDECDAYPAAPAHMGTTEGIVNAGGTGYQVPRMDEPSAERVNEYLRDIQRDFDERR